MKPSEEVAQLLSSVPSDQLVPEKKPHTIRDASIGGSAYVHLDDLIMWILEQAEKAEANHRDAVNSHLRLQLKLLREFRETLRP